MAQRTSNNSKANTVLFELAANVFKTLRGYVIQPIERCYHDQHHFVANHLQRTFLTALPDKRSSTVT